MVDEHNKTIESYELDNSIAQIKASFNDFVSEFKQADTTDAKYTLIEQIITSLTNLPKGYAILAEFELFTHDIFVILRDYAIINLLRQKQVENNTTQTVLLSTSTLFMNLCNCINNTNTNNYKDLLFHKPLIDELAYCLHEMGTYGKYLNDPTRLRSVKFLLRAFKNTLIHSMTTDNYSLIAPIFFAVVECLCSQHAIDMIKGLESNFFQKLDEGQMLFLDAIPLYLKWYWDYGHPEIFIKILRILLNEFTSWFASCQPESYLQRSSQIDSMIGNITHVLIRPTEFSNVSLFSEEFYHHYSTLVLHWSLILSSVFSYPSCSTDIISSTRSSTRILYSFTLHLNIANFMKNIPNLILILLKATELDDDEIQLNAYRCLGKIMIGADIKTMAKPEKIVAVYVDFIKNTIDNPNRVERFYSLLESLKNFVQHDQVKCELTKQEALPLLIMCVVKNHFDPIKVQLLALEIPFALSFQNEACYILRQNEQFMIHVRILTQKTYENQLSLQRAAEGLLWKLEKESEAVTKQIILNSYKYNIMLSYSHKDEQLCLKIHEQLIKDGFRVWLGIDCLRGSTMVGIANAIENSEHVVICMSNMYKQSVYCQSEAHYAFECRCRLIPIIVESNYKPDGWLGIIVSGKIYVNFAKDEFSKAYEKLKNEISEQRYQNEIQSSIKLERNHQTNTNSMTSERVELIYQSTV
ncbi:unnamed protein product [Rotaria socialis]